MTGGRILDDWLKSYMEYNQETESAKLFHKWTGISCIAAALRWKVWLNQGRIKVRPNLYIVFVAEPGESRKTQAITWGEEIMIETPNIVLAANSITREALFQDIEDAEFEEMMPDGTPARHNSLSVVSGEFESFLGQKSENTRMLVTLTDLWDGKVRPFEHRTKHSGSTKIERVYLNLIAATTPQSLASSLPPTAVGGGLATRIIFIWNEGKARKIAIPEETAAIRKLKTELIRDLSIIGRIKGAYEFNKPGKAWWIHWYNNFEEKDPKRICKDPAFNGWYSRKPTFILKLAQIISASRTDNLDISPDTLREAVFTIEEAENNMGRTFSAVGRSAVTADVDLVNNVVKEHKTISETALLQLVWRDMDFKKFENVIATCVKSGLVGRAYQGPKGQTGIWYSWKGV